MAFRARQGRVGDDFQRSTEPPANLTGRAIVQQRSGPIGEHSGRNEDRTGRHVVYSILELGEQVRRLLVGIYIVLSRGEVFSLERCLGVAA